MTKENTILKIEFVWGFEDIQRYEGTEEEFNKLRQRIQEETGQTVKAWVVAEKGIFPRYSKI